VGGGTFSGDVKGLAWIFGRELTVWVPLLPNLTWGKSVLPIEGLREATRVGGREREPNQILSQEPAYVPSVKPQSQTLERR
jgi:hypothetical protein